MKDNMIFGFAMIMNLGFFLGFGAGFLRLKKGIKRSLYTNNKFREIDYKAKNDFLKITLFFAFNFIVLAFAIYETNN